MADRKRSREPLEQEGCKKARKSQSLGKSWMSLARAREVLHELRSFILPQRFRDQLAALLGQQAGLFRVAPSKITVELFSKRYGMIQLIPDAMPLYDRFNRKRFPVREDALRTAGGCVFKDVYTSARHLGFPRHESTGSSIFSRLLCSFALFMMYKAESGDEDEPEKEDAELHLGTDVEPSDPDEESSDPEEDVVFMDLEFPDDSDCLDEDYQEPSSDESEPGMDTLVTSSEDEQAELEACEQESEPRWHSDILAFTTSKTGVRVLRLGIDVKTVVKHRDLLQVFMYVDGHSKGTSKLGKQARPPVYLHAMDMREWRYAISEIDGYVQVKGNELLEESLHSFPDTAAQPLSDEFTSSFTKDEVRNKFQTWKESLQAENVEILPDGLYPVGRLYYSTKAWGMPVFESGFAALSSGALKLYSGWLHVLIGKRVRRWTPEKVWDRFFRHEFAHLMVGMRRARGPWLSFIKGKFLRS